MDGFIEEASAYYKEACEISTRLLSFPTISNETLKRCVDACANCFDFCNNPEDDEQNEYLDSVSSMLTEIVAGHHESTMRMAALEAYADIARLSYLVAKCCRSEKAKSVISDFYQCWNRYSPSLVCFH
ncbi:hypothetical protein Marme_1743 [Marinomonas mediterranea MMB-1]|uniref:Uncharacterized protein n=2 Tax=Marinomonas mediterranea TaxID=119864 RepID=F2K0L5_MARM1|nr:hypothetical protein Marme_1743 [Marinomonas mediterranea MMB-1]